MRYVIATGASWSVKPLIVNLKANVLEPGWQWSFFGANYGRLRDIKTRYDPDDMLWCPQCVGSEGWTEEGDGKLCRTYLPF